MGRTGMTFTPHSLRLLNVVDRVACLVIEGEEIAPEARERIACAQEVLTRILDGRITEGTDHLEMWGKVSRIGRENAA